MNILCYRPTAFFQLRNSNLAREMLFVFLGPFSVTSEETAFKQISSEVRSNLPLQAYLTYSATDCLAFACFAFTATVSAETLLKRP